MMQGMRNLLNLKVILGAVVVGLCMFGALIALLSTSRGMQPNLVDGTAVLYVIPAPTFTPPAPLIPPTEIPTPTQPIPAAPPSAAISVGANVQITGTEGDGLRLRVDPGLNGTVRFLAIEAEIFQVMDGPIELDGYIWWNLQAPYDATVQGWAVANYLIVVQNP